MFGNLVEVNKESVNVNIKLNYLLIYVIMCPHVVFINNERRHKMNIKKAFTVEKVEYGEGSVAIISVSTEYQNVCVLSFSDIDTLWKVQREYPQFPVYFQAETEHLYRGGVRLVEADEREKTLWWDMPVKVCSLKPRKQ